MSLASEKAAPARARAAPQDALTARVPAPRISPEADARLSQPEPMPRALTTEPEQRVVLHGSRHKRLRTQLGRIRAWMLVLPVDAALLLAPLLWSSQHVRASLTMAALSVLMLCRFSRYRARLSVSVLDELPDLLSRLLTAAAVVATVTALRHEQGAVTTFLANTAWAIGLVVAGRVATTQLILWSRRRRITAHRTVIIGGGALSAELAQVLGGHPRYGLEVVGFVDDGSGRDAEMVVPRLGRVRDLDEVVRRSKADVALVGDGDFSERVLLDAVRTPGCIDCDLLVVPRLHWFHTQTGFADQIGSIPIMRIRTPNLAGPAWAVKRAFDVAVSSALLLLTAPVIGILMLAVRIEGGPGVLFVQPRVGRDLRLFGCIKLRSMRPTDDKESATTWSIAHDDRVGPVGRFLRRTSLDELPQLWNILRGDMTLVGPRPERPHFVEEFSARYDRYAHRHRVQAGLTGFAQVSGLRGDTPIADRAGHDNYYIENWSLWLDTKILLRTIFEVIFAHGR
jgi:exopolysaccharide biosynthesis polyprenyl glycosylphosphotransferase